MTPSYPARPGTLDDVPGYRRGEQIRLMRPEGSGSIKVLMMGEALGKHENADQLPFRPYAEAGSVLERALRFCGLDRSQFTITNAVWWQPPHDQLSGAWYEHRAIGMCRSWNDALVAERQPRCLLALGGIPMRELSGMSGHRQGIKMLRGFPLPSIYQDIPVVGSYHPSFLRRGEKQESEEGVDIESAAGMGMDLLGVLIHDIQYAVSIARAGAPFVPARDYRLWGTVSSLERLYEEALNHPELPVGWDIENDELLEAEDESEVKKLVMTEAVTQIQFSLRKDEAWVFHMDDSLAPWIVKLMSLPNVKLGFNDRLSDRPILRDFLRDKGHLIEYKGECHDLMNMWHHAQPDLPKGLQFVASFYCPQKGPWKHLNISDRGVYGGMDVDTLHWIWEKLPGDIRKLGIWEGYERHVHQLSKTLDKISVTGIPVNDEKRQAFGRYLDAERKALELELQACVPDDVRPIHPKEGWKKLPPAAKLAITEWWLENRQGLIDWGALPDRIEAKDGVVFAQREFGEIDQSAFIENKVKRWCRLDPFNPNSPVQLKAYIEFKRKEEIDAFRKRGFAKEQAEKKAKYAVPRDFKTGEETTGKRELLRLAKATGDPLFSGTVRVREFSKLKGTYVDGWAPADDGRAHPSFGYAPATSQLSSEDPNAQNVPSEKSRGAALSPTIIKLAEQFREIIEAPPGYTLLEFDWKAFHALMLGFVAKDASYMRLARLDIHSYFAATGLLKIARSDKLLAMHDDELAEYLAWVKAKYTVVRDGQAKPAILGYGLGMRGYTLWQQNPESFSSRVEADAALDAIDGEFPISAAWRRNVLREANDGNDQHGPNCLIFRPWTIRRFWSVYENKPVKLTYKVKRGERIFVDGRGQHWKVGHGSDAEAAIAFYVQNLSHGHMKENMLTIDERGWADRFGLCNTVHDALWFCCREELAEHAYAMIKPQMETRSAILRNEIEPEGFWCAVEATIGKSMAAKDRRKFKV